MIIGEGVLTWFRQERIGDRYGAVYLGTPSGQTHQFGGLDLEHGSKTLDQKQEGIIGTLKAIIVEARQSSHIGDMFRGFKPNMPNVGDTITLGTGLLFFEEESEHGEPYYQVGVKPIDNRNTDWMDPQSLYNCHEQTVRLEFNPS